jgi:hypothetical protein
LAALADTTTKVAMQFAAGKAATAGAVSAKAAALTREVLRAMFLAKLKTGGMLVLLLGLIMGGAALVRVWAGAVESLPQKASDASKDEDKKKLQGTWYTVSVESRGMKVPVERIVVKNVRLVVKSDGRTLKETQGDADKDPGPCQESQGHRHPLQARGKQGQDLPSPPRRFRSFTWCFSSRQVTRMKNCAGHAAGAGVAESGSKPLPAVARQAALSSSKSVGVISTSLLWICSCVWARAASGSMLKSSARASSSLTSSTSTSTSISGSRSRRK